MRALVLVAAAWLAALVVLCLACTAAGAPPFRAASWAHWDSGFYVSIAQHGYEIHRCRPGETPKPATWCGNSGWFPLYPWAIRALHALGAPAVAAGVAIAFFFALVALLLLWYAFLSRLPRGRALLGLAYAAFAPGYVYEFAVYPLSLFVSGCAAFLLAVRARRWTLAAVAGFLAALAYPIGVVALPLVALVYVGWTTRRVAPTLLAAAPPLVAYGVIALVQQVETGRALAFLDTQQKYGAGIRNPFTVTWGFVADVWRAGSPLSWGAAPYWQTVLVTAVLLLVLVLAAWRREPLLLVFAVLIWAVPLTHSDVSIWRSQDALLPMAPLVARLPRPLALVAVAAAVVVGFAVAHLYFEGALV